MKKILFAMCAIMFLSSFDGVAQTLEKLDSIVSQTSKTIYTWDQSEYNWDECGYILKKVIFQKSDNGWQEKEHDFYEYDTNHNKTFEENCTYNDGVISLGLRSEYTYEDNEMVTQTYYSWENGKWQKDSYIYDKTIGDTLRIYRIIYYTDGEVSSGYGYNETITKEGDMEYTETSATFIYENGEWIPLDYAKRKDYVQDDKHKSECTYDSLGRKDEELFYYLSDDNQWTLSERNKYVYTDMPLDSMYAVYHYNMLYLGDQEFLDGVYYYLNSEENPIASIDPTNPPYQYFSLNFYPGENARETYTLYVIDDYKLAVGHYDYIYSTYFEEIMISKWNKQACNHKTGGELVTSDYRHTVTTRDTLYTAKVLWKDYLGQKILYKVSLDEQGNELSRSDYYYSEVTSTAIPDLSQQTASPSACYDLTGRRISNPSTHHGLILKNINGKIKKVYQ